jgi:hypothetical protein
VFESNTATWSLIAGFASTMNDLSGGAAAACTADSPVAAVPPACSSKEGTGYEGPACNIDINECARQTAGCHPDAACTNTPGSFSCRCFDGYEGDGASCSPTAALTAVQAEYVTDGKAQLACSEGSNLVYPEGAPGYQYDPTGALERVKDGGQQVGLQARRCMVHLLASKQGLMTVCHLYGCAAGRLWVTNRRGARQLHAGLQRCPRM